MISAGPITSLNANPAERVAKPASEIVVIHGVTTTVKVAHLRLCHSRMPFVRAYPRDAQLIVTLNALRRDGTPWRAPQSA